MGWNCSLEALPKKFLSHLRPHRISSVVLMGWLLLFLLGTSVTALQPLLRHSPLILPLKGNVHPLNSIRGGENLFTTLKSNLNDLSPKGTTSIPPFLQSLTDNYMKTPPISRIFMSSSFLVTFFSYLFLNNQWPEVFIMNWKALSRLQFWRILTGFLYFGPFGINYLFTMQFLWQYISQIEKLYYAQPERFLLLLGYGAASLLLSYLYFGLSTHYLGHNLCAYLVYIWSRIFEGVSVNLMGLATVPAELLPWLFCLQSILLDGHIPWTDFLGIIAGHLYLLSEKSGWIQPPAALVRWFRTPLVRRMYQRYSRDFE